jgi:hypothetical protein
MSGVIFASAVMVVIVSASSTIALCVVATRFLQHRSQNHNETATPRPRPLFTSSAV